jgi:hypothetical protein
MNKNGAKLNLKKNQWNIWKTVQKEDEEEQDNERTEALIANRKLIENLI